jgi:hypothetical protein
MKSTFDVGDLVYRSVDGYHWLYEILEISNEHSAETYLVYRHVNTWKPDGGKQSYLDFDTLQSDGALLIVVGKKCS